MKKYTWRLKLLKGKIKIYEYNREIGKVDAFGFLKKHSSIKFYDRQLFFNSKFTTESQVVIYDKQNSFKSELLDVKLFTSTAFITINGTKYTYKAAFLGIGNVVWKTSTDDFVTIDFKGNIESTLSDDYLNMILIGSGLQLIVLFSSFIFTMIIFIYFIIF